NKLREQLAQKVYGASVAIFGPPPVRGVGRAGGFALMIEDRGDFGPAVLQSQTENLVAKGINLNRAGQDIAQLRTSFPNSSLGTRGKPSAEADLQPALLGMFSVFRANVPQLHVDPNPGACMMRGV